MAVAFKREQRQTVKAKEGNHGCGGSYYEAACPRCGAVRAVASPGDVHCPCGQLLFYDCPNASPQPIKVFEPPAE